MAHFAKISEDNEVLQVLTLNDSDTTNAEGQEVEAIGQAYLEKHHNWPANLWIKTSYNTHGNIHRLGGTPFRGNYAGMGYTWDVDNQIFWPPQFHTTWVKDIESASWKSPIGDAPELTEEQNNQNAANTNQWSYVWNDETTAWDLTDILI